jgi:hypothetical protein
MRLDDATLDSIKRVHRALIRSLSSQNLFPLVTQHTGVKEIEAKKALIFLEKFGFIKDLKISGNAFSTVLIRKKEINADWLIDERDFILVSMSNDEDTDEKSSRETSALKAEIENLKKKLANAQRDLRCYKRYGKSFKEKVESAKINHGEGTKI